MATGFGLEPADKYEALADLGAGNFGVAKLMRNKMTGEPVAIKFIERGERVDRNVEREILNHRVLNHPNIVAFKEVFLTPTHLAIAMEYAAGGELFERIVKAGRFSEDEARYFFQQLISGVDYCHRSGVCHRDLKLENTLLDGNPAPRLKICDFGYSKSALDSQPKSTVGTPAYIAPEVLQRKEYSGAAADVWSCGVTLFVMLVGAYPFEDSTDPRNFRKTIQRIMCATYAFPPGLTVSPECRDLVSRIFAISPQQRITIEQIRAHPWFMKNLPHELANHMQYARNPEPPQTLDEIRALIEQARSRYVQPIFTQARPYVHGEVDDDYMDSADAGGSGSGTIGHDMYGGGQPSPVSAPMYGAQVPMMPGQGMAATAFSVAPSTWAGAPR